MNNSSFSSLISPKNPQYNSLLCCSISLIFFIEISLGVPAIAGVGWRSLMKSFMSLLSEKLKTVFMCAKFPAFFVLGPDSVNNSPWLLMQSVMWSETNACSSISFLFQTISDFHFWLPARDSVRKNFDSLLEISSSGPVSYTHLTLPTN